MERGGIYSRYMQNVKITIREPMRDGSVGIRSSLVEEAIKRGVGLEITTPEGTSVVDPNVWKSRSRVMKKEGNYPGNPMVLYIGWVPSSNPEQTRKKVTTTKVTTIVIEEVETKLLRSLDK